jgi:hypothetical protein
MTKVERFGCGRLAAIVSYVLATACSSGGGSGTPTVQAAATPAASLPQAPNIGSPDAATLGTNSAVLATTGTTLKTMPIGTVLPLRQSILNILSSQEDAAPYFESGGATLTFKGTQTANGVTGPVFTLDIPKMGITQTLQPSGAGGPCCGFSDVSIKYADTLNYTMTGAWNAGTDGTVCGTCTAMFVTGFQTPSSNVPANGQASYLSGGAGSTGNGSVSGAIYALGSGAQAGVINGSSSSFNVNFSNGQVTGTLSGLTATPLTTTGVLGTPQPWNQINIAGSLSGAVLSGTTSTPSQPTGSLGFGTNSIGTIGGALFGPNAEEFGAVWSLQDKLGTKNALGVVSATKQ